MSKHSVRKFWPLDFDPEVEIYESLSWDLAGRRPVRKLAGSSRSTSVRRPKRG
jgi:hypothetical protein